MKLFIMNCFSLNFALFTGLIALLPTAAMADLILADNFDHYEPGAAPFASNWTLGMSGNSTAHWRSGGAPAKGENGPQAAREIVNAPDRSGTAFHYTESSTTANYPYIYHDLETPYSDVTMDWQMTVDFRIDTLNSSSGFWLGGIYGTTSRNTTDLIALADVLRVTEGADTTLQVRFSYRTDAGGGGKVETKTFTISEDTWYTLVIAGNNQTQMLSYSIDGLGSTAGYYRSDQNGIATVLLGDANSGFSSPGSSVYLDNFELRSIPEGSSIALMLPGVIVGCLFGSRLCRQQ